MKAWTVETLDEIVEEELNALPADMRALYTKISELIETHGLQYVGEPHVEHLQGKLWQIRMKGRDGIARAPYVTARDRRVVVVRVFVKKTRRTPKSEIDLSLERAKRVKDE
jgi:phage-related protein